MTSFDNEVVFESGVGLENLDFVIVPNADDRKMTIGALRAKGVTEINGRPLEEVIRGRE